VQYLFATERHVVLLVELQGSDRAFWALALDRKTGVESWRVQL
jgi:hypothetical protein